MRILGAYLAGLCVLLAAATATAQPQALELDEALVLLETLGEPERFPSANSVIGFSHSYVDFEESGAYDEYHHVFIKILTDEGLRRHGDESFVFNRRYGSIDIQTARVVKQDGTEVIVGEDLITDGTPAMVAAMDIYESDLREVTVVFPNLEVGDAIEILVHMEFEPLVENGYNGFHIVQDISPVVETSVTIVGPASMPLKHAVKGGELEFAETEAEGKRTYEWRGENLPQIDPEPAMPGLAQVATRIVVSTVQTWADLSRYLWAMSDEKCVAEETVIDLVEEITEGLETREEKIRAIHYWIAENVRYLGISMDRGAFLEPHFAAYTLENEYGICRDKAVLMVTMFEEIGVPSWIVAVNVNRTTDTEVPTVFFEHGIVAIEGPDGDYLYIDPTQQTSREIYATYLSDRWVLLLTEVGSDIRRAPAVPASRNSGRIVDASTLREDGSIGGSVTITGSGMYEEILRTISRQAGREQIEMAWDEAVQGLYPGAAMTRFEITDSEDLSEPMAITVAYDVTDYALAAEPYLLFRVPAATGSFDFLSDVLFSRLMGLASREYPLALQVTLGLEEEAEVAVPADYELTSLPDDVAFEEGVITLEIDYEFVPPPAEGGHGIVKYRHTFAINSFQVSPEDYLSLKEAVRLAGRSARGEVILMKKEG
jgi:hypothetical protein